MRNSIPALATLVVLASLASLVVPSAARAGKVSLDTALQRSELVVTIQLDTPHTTRVEVPVPMPSEKECAPYPSYVVTGKVVAVAHPTKMRFTVVSEEERIVVFPADIRMLVDLTQRACLDGTSKSPSFERFAGAELSDGATRTALLRWENGFGWTEAVSGSWLEKAPSKAKLASVQRMRFIENPEKHDGLCVTAADCIEDDLSCEPCGSCLPNPPVSSAMVGRYIALCHEAKKPKPGNCGSCGDRLSEHEPRTRVACRAMRCVLEALSPRTPKAAPVSPPTPATPAAPATPATAATP